MAIQDKLLYRIREVAEHLNVRRSKVYELLKSGQLRSVHIDRTRLVRRVDLEETWNLSRLQADTPSPLGGCRAIVVPGR